MIVGIAVPAAGPLFEGHFPGRPILPGIAELVLVARALAPETGAVDVCAIPFARFRGLVLPADALEVEASPRGDAGGIRFEVRRGGAIVANGAMTFGVPRPAEEAGRATPSRSGRDTTSIEDLIPHRPPMRFVERILVEAERGATALARIPRACALVSGGLSPTYVALEAAAQTAAAWEALRRSRGGGDAGARMGYLVSLKDVVAHRGAIPADSDLTVSVRLEALAPPLANYAFDVAIDGALVLSGAIGTYLSD